MTSNTAEVAIHDLQRHIGAVRALDGVSLEIPTGETLAVLGPSGCGKSTLLRLLAGLDTPTGGEIHIAGQKVNGNGLEVPPERRPVNMVFQDFALWPHMNVKQILQYGMKYRGIARGRRDQRVTELLELVDLGGMEKRYPRELSGGQQQRVAIARALATEPRVLLFDEPLSNLDSQLRQQMRDDLARLLRELGTTALYVTHDLQEALALGQRVVVMQAGRIAQIDETRELFRKPATPWVAELVGYANTLDGRILRREDDWALVQAGQQTLWALCRDHELADGDATQIMFQPRGCRLSQQAPQESNLNTLPVQVEQQVFEGHGWRINCRHGQRLLQVHDALPHDAGAGMALAFEKAATHAYRRSEEAVPVETTETAARIA
ncbi:ABC transporter ATP-binding protein [Aquisalimonas asiatica]|uniref:Putative spermidine/putrescine transport system ATP-binding protein n=1 Tax=Aquisalimonas asiatica TaxID=406100 RepID=A0A1H8RT51_9GAMM|nr:ABC transporter ATP-binding protein [Aquisalimonas asiatica]SEO69123.1 putative spermidine/putrescine transport system ATP-binding protein [Aquisalimonas asiatica]